MHINGRLKYIQVHQIRVYANKGETNLVPEGIHRDGFDIIAIVCINRNNICGGSNNVYDNNKIKMYNTTLQEGDIMILNDKEVLHDVTSIKLANGKYVGYRDIFVLTTDN